MIQVILSLFCLKKTIDLASMNRLNTITDQSPPSNMHLFHIPSTRPETVAAVDLGSNSFHMIVASFENNQLKIIDKIKEMDCRMTKASTRQRQTKRLNAWNALASVCGHFPRGQCVQWAPTP
jgi:hypothetical protein